MENGKREGAWISYYSNGLLISKGNYRNGKKEGAWISYLLDGSLRSGTYKDGAKISD